MRVKNCLLLTVVLSGGLALSTAAQTGRIALASHAGRMAEVGDNFGIVYTVRVVVDSIAYQNDTMAVVYSRRRSVEVGSSTDELRHTSWLSDSYSRKYYSGQYNHQAWEAAVAELHRSSPQAKLIGFDKQRKKHGSKKPSGNIDSFPTRPFQYSYWRGLAGVAALGAVGWLLGRKPGPKVR